MNFVKAETRTAVVTGAASGIGRAIAEHLLGEGWAVAALDRDELGLASLEQQAWGRVTVRPTDVSDSADVDRAFAQARDELGPLGAAISAAGVWAPGTAAELSDEQWDRCIAVNLTGTFNTARAALSHLLTDRGGSFVAIASDVGVQGSQSCAAYVAAKHGVVGLVRSMALDFGARGIRSNAVCPGFVETPMSQEIFRQQSPGVVEVRRNEVPMGRFAEPVEIASVVASLVTPAYSFVNGSILTIDGGATAGYYSAPVSSMAAP